MPRPKANVINFSVNVPTKSSGRSRKLSSRPDTPVNLLPSGSPPDASMGWPSSTVRQRPIASKFSSEKPTGSIRLWQLAQAALTRCSARRSRTERLADSVLSFSAGTLGNGGGGGVPRMFSSTHLPRMTGEVRVARSEEHTSELQSQSNLVCRLLLEKKNQQHRPLGG